MKTVTVALLLIIVLPFIQLFIQQLRTWINGSQRAGALDGNFKEHSKNNYLVASEEVLSARRARPQTGHP
jgi:cell division protein FtsB